MIKILQMILRFYTYVISSFKIDGARSLQSPNQFHACPCYQYYFLGPLCEERGGRQNRPSLYADVVGSPREDSHIKMKGILVGKLKLNYWGRPVWVWLKLKLSLKGDFCEVSVTAIFANFFMYRRNTWMSIFSHFPAFRREHPKWDQNLQTTSTRVTFVWEAPQESKSPSVPLDFS